MDKLIFLLLLFIAFLLIIGLPIGLSYLVYLWTKRRRFDRRLRLLALTPIILFIYAVYDSFYPSDDFYKEDYEEVTSQKFPENGKILSKSASFPDHFGDYNSAALIEIDSSECQILQARLVENNFEEDSIEFSSTERRYVEKELSGRIYEVQLKKEINEGKYYFVGFLSDGKSIVYQRISW
ncbi:hypothetical protein [Tunicatimonas pelagia]|uniref:hypothetical protein n=1 Tax=Tunicatimonas pelagia TaxID=931531 RepID=UPI0026671797|nr:hypothetical protein [Tunicatimonas pelagia]WKN41426.1 hypothetical protein P0M28_20530 [Tunicatimonas pelagia]